VCTQSSVIIVIIIIIIIIIVHQVTRIVTFYKCVHGHTLQCTVSDNHYRLFIL